MPPQVLDSIHLSGIKHYIRYLTILATPCSLETALQARIPMHSKTPTGADADYFQVLVDRRTYCGHPHRSIDSAVRCLQDTPGAVGIVAVRKRRDAIGSARMYNRDAEYLTDRQVQALIDWQQRRRGKPVETEGDLMRQVKSCGVLLFRRTPELAFLVMKHRNRLDLPKGHIEPGETEVECALREFEEETGISKHHVSLDPDFRFETSYQARYKRFGNELVNKTLVVFLGYLNAEAQVVATEHPGFEWIAWNPPHRIQAETIDPLLKAVEGFIVR